MQPEGDTLMWTRPNEENVCCRRVDNEGDYVLENTSTGTRANLYFTPCGWFSSGRYQVGTPVCILHYLCSASSCCAAGAALRIVICKPGITNLCAHLALAPMADTSKMSMTRRLAGSPVCQVWSLIHDDLMLTVGRV